MPKTEKWFIPVDRENVDLIQKFLEEHKDEYIGYSSGWSVRAGSYFHYPQKLIAGHSYGYFPGNALPFYKEISTQEFLQIIENQLVYEIF